MKHYLLAGLLLAAVPAVAQTAPTDSELRASGAESPVPFKGANIILVHTTDSMRVAVKNMARALIVAGIEPDKIDSDIGYLTTKPKPVGTLSPATFQYKIVASPEPTGTVLSITGDYTVKVNLVNSLTSTMFWSKGNIAQGRQCFALIEPVAQAYPNGKLGYKSKIEKNIVR
jgi:hypothetical protein